MKRVSLLLRGYCLSGLSTLSLEPLLLVVVVDNVTVKERVHFLVGVDTFGCTTLLFLRANEDVVGHCIEQICNLFLLILLLIDFDEQPDLGLQVYVVRNLY